MLRVLLILVPLALVIYALVDCITSDDEDIKHLPKLVWILLIVLGWVVGPVAWILVGRKRGAPRAGGFGRRGAGGGWVAPDDNPEFLRSLGDDRAREESEREEKDREEKDKDKELLESWEEDLRRREEEMRRGEGEDDTPPGSGKDR
ncbi:PLD nuclease N-terminal domain-containing protein [Streptomyces radicis]|uniref:PLDc_N domain-containing protein n=1 Tax=Streptomyces radicis TaxID=1750517 RepID=A0A3A9W9N3_9ACTN|nr:PLD nuclease N-terminal domain-containing protein [Streptomyces radicis]RKN09785.1 PLDc_N domain-containing protein [Streptomyces radicis]RKN23422.1 PLDc_N domain-containing protein [Streptomyces radicis]